MELSVLSFSFTFIKFMPNGVNKRESEFLLSFKSSSLTANSHLDILLKEVKKAIQVANDFISRLKENEIDDSSAKLLAEVVYKT